MGGGWGEGPVEVDAFAPGDGGGLAVLAPEAVDLPGIHISVLDKH